MAMATQVAPQQQQPAAAPTDTAAAETPPGPIYIDTQHEDLVHDTQMDYYGAKLATCSSDRTVKVYDVSETSYELCATLQGHEGPVWQVSWAHPKFGVILASCSFDGSVLIHVENNASAQQSRKWTLLHAARHLHESSVNGCAFSPPEYGLQLAAASSDGKVSILQHQPNNTWAVDYLNDCPMGVNAVSWAPVGAYFDPNQQQTSQAAEGEQPPQQQQAAAQSPSATATTESPRLVTAGCDNQIRFWVCHQAGEWALDASQCESSNSSSSNSTSVVQHSDWVRDVAWAPVMVPNVNTVASCSEDGTVIIWTQHVTHNNNATTGTESASTQASHPWKATLLHRFDAPVWRVSWSVTGHLLAVSSGDSNVTLWKKATIHNENKWVQVNTDMQQVTEETSSPAAAVGGAPPPPPPQG